MKCARPRAVGYLRRSDLGHIGLRLRIRKLPELREFGRQEALVLVFDETHKYLVLTDSIVAQLEAEFGCKANDWTGRRVVIWAEAGNMQIRAARRRSGAAKQATRRVYLNQQK
jgi:hypothetical protein